MGLCHLSKTVYSLQNKLKDCHMDIMSKIPSTDLVVSVEAPEDVEEPTFSLPLKTIEDLQEFEEKLKEKQFFTTIANVLVKNIEKTNISKSARSTLKQVMDDALYQKYSWKGQQRKGRAESKDCFYKLRICDLIHKCVRMVWPNEVDLKKKIETTLASFLAQQASLYLKRSSVTSVGGEATDNLGEII